MATIVIPRALASTYGIVFRMPVTPSGTASAVIGVLLFLCGITLAVSSVLRFAIDGDGTLAPWDPPRRFVATGPYRFVRNPMISGVTMVLIAQSMVFRSLIHLEWAVVFAFINAAWIPFVEEPGLHARFGDSYREYCRHVRRLLPRLTPYVEPNFSSAGTGAAGLKSGPTHHQIFAVVPASGKSSRFGSDKRQVLIDGVPMLLRVVKHFKDAGIADVIVVDDNPDPDRGMFSSIQIGLGRALASGAEIILVQPADMPFVRIETIRLIAAECARTGRAVCPRYDDQRGHPLAFPAELARQLLTVDPSTPLNEAFTAIGLVRSELTVDDPGVLRDIDTLDDLMIPPPRT